MSVAGAGEVWERAKSLQEKMHANLQMARDRLDVLGTASILSCSVFIHYLSKPVPLS